MNAPGFRTLLFTARIRDLGELPEDGVQKPTEPHAFAFTILANAVHSVIPVARAHQRQAVFSDLEAAIESTRAMLE